MSAADTQAGAAPAPGASAPVLFWSPGAASLGPHIALEEIGRPFGLRRFSTRDGANRTPEYLAINPRGRIPALAADGFVLTEAAAILAWLARRHPEAGLWPADARAEARCLEWLAFLSTTLHVSFHQITRANRYAAGEAHHPAVQESGRANIAHWGADIEGRLARQEAQGEGPWACGSAYSAADAALFTVWWWISTLGPDAHAAHPAWTGHATRMAARPAVRRALATEGLHRLLALAPDPATG